MAPLSALRALALGALVTACALPAAGGAGGAIEAVPTPPGCPATLGGEVLARVNGIRREHGLRPLRAELALVEAAQAHTEDQAATEPAAMGHVGSDGSAPGQRATRAGYRWRMVAENVAAGYATPDQVVRGWMSSPPHRSTILAPEPVHGGVGHVYRAGGRLHHFWTLLVAAPAEAPGDGPDAARAVDCHP